MIIGAPTLQAQGDHLLLSHRVELETKKVNVPQHLWFTLPASCEGFALPQSESAVASLLLLAMSLGEDVEVDGHLSECFAYGLREYQRIFQWAWPRQLKAIQVRCRQYRLAQQETTTPSGVGCAFSGGIDSFYTLWSHLAQNEPLKEFQISHGVFVHGFDIPLEDVTNYQRCKSAYQAMFARLGLQLLDVQTNARAFCNHLSWGEIAFGPALLGVALLFNRWSRRFYIASDQTYDFSTFVGSDPRANHLLSTERFQIVHHGAATPKVEKAKALSIWPETYFHLRVCWQKPNGVINCCRCRKCLTTMLMLGAIGSLSKYSTFPLPFRGLLLLSFSWRTVPEYMPALIRYRSILLRSVLQQARQNRRTDIVFWVLLSLLQGRIYRMLNFLRQAASALRKRLLQAFRLQRDGRW